MMKFNVQNVFAGKYGTKFNLVLELENRASVTIYGCRVVEGQDGDFIGWPSYKDTSGHYWKHVYVAIGPADVEDILSEVEAQKQAQAGTAKGSKRRR